MIIVQRRWLTLRRERGAALSTTKRRGNSEGSNPVQRADGRYEHIRHTDEDGSSSRHTFRATVPKRQEIRPQRLELGSAPTCLPRIARSPRRVHGRLDRIDPRGVGSTSNHDEPVRDDGTHAHHRCQDRCAAAGQIPALPTSTELKGRGLAESSIRTADTVLHAVLDTAVRDKAIAQNQAHAVRCPKVTRQGGCLPDAGPGPLVAPRC
jgi:hypothetical protein